MQWLCTFFYVQQLWLLFCLQEEGIARILGKTWSCKLRKQSNSIPPKHSDVQKKCSHQGGVWGIQKFDLPRDNNPKSKSHKVASSATRATTDAADGLTPAESKSHRVSLGEHEATEDTKDGINPQKDVEQTFLTITPKHKHTEVYQKGRR